MRLIDAESIQYEPMLSAKGNGMYEDVMVSYKSQIDDLPTIEERKKGKWLKAYGDHEACGVRPFYRYCSECNESTVWAYNYCPNCGSYNGGGEHGQTNKQG